MKYLKKFENLDYTRDIENDLLIIKDILTDLEDSHGINFDTYIGKFFNKYSSVRTLWGSVPSEPGFVSVRAGIYANSININLTDEDFIFNEQILPTINTIKSHLEEVNIVIVKGIGDLFYDSSKNKYYPLDEFIKEHGSEEFNELEIILY
jgi:hypothetical protein